MPPEQMIFVRVVKGQLLAGELPSSGTLSNGQTVSNYDRLPEKILREEGWVKISDPGPPPSDPNRVATHKRDIVLKAGRPVVQYTPIFAPERVEVTPDRVIVVYTNQKSVTFEVQGQETKSVVVDTTDGKAELAVKPSKGHGHVTVRIVELEEEVEVAL